MTARILAFGSRTLTDEDYPHARQALHDGLEAIMATGFFANAELHHGDCEGADRMFAEEWTALGGVAVAHPAKWSVCLRTCRPGHRKFRRDGSSWCPSAGFRRNKFMVGEGADLAVKAHLNGSKGTAMTANLCEAAGIHVVDIFALDLAQAVEPYRQED
jgi:hypothetical protein